MPKRRQCIKCQGCAPSASLRTCCFQEHVPLTISMSIPCVTLSCTEEFRQSQTASYIIVCNFLPLPPSMPHSHAAAIRCPLGRGGTTPRCLSTRLHHAVVQAHDDQNNCFSDGCSLSAQPGNTGIDLLFLILRLCRESRCITISTPNPEGGTILSSARY